MFSLARFTTTVGLVASTCLAYLSPSTAQISSDDATFEVATLRQHIETGGSPSTPFAQALSGMASMRGGPGTKDPEGFYFENARLKLIIETAYGLIPSRVFGPAWIDETRYDIAGKIPKGASHEDLLVMLRNLLRERIGLHCHRETRQLPIYRLRLAKTGQLSSSDVPSKSSCRFVDPVDLKKVETPWVTHIQCRHITMSDFAAELAHSLSREYIDRPVSDATGLAGAYDFDLRWVGPSTVPLSHSYGTIFEEIDRQLGLKLEPSRGPVEVLVVDAASRVPIEN